MQPRYKYSISYNEGLGNYVLSRTLFDTKERKDAQAKGKKGIEIIATKGNLIELILLMNNPSQWPEDINDRTVKALSINFYAILSSPDWISADDKALKKILEPLADNFILTTKTSEDLDAKDIPFDDDQSSTIRERITNNFMVLQTQFNQICARNRLISQLHIEKKISKHKNNPKKMWGLIIDKTVDQCLKSFEAGEPLIRYTSYLKKARNFFRLGEFGFDRFFDYATTPPGAKKLNAFPFVFEPFEPVNTAAFFEKLRHKTVPFKKITFSRFTEEGGKTTEIIFFNDIFLKALFDFLKNNPHLDCIDFGDTMFHKIDTLAFDRFCKKLEKHSITTLIKLYPVADECAQKLAMICQKERKKETGAQPKVVLQDRTTYVYDFKKNPVPDRWWKPIKTKRGAHAKRQYQQVQEVATEMQTQQESQAPDNLGQLLTRVEAEKELENHHGADGIIKALIGSQLKKDSQIELFSMALINQIKIHPEAFIDGIVDDPSDLSYRWLPEGVGVALEEDGSRILFYDSNLRKDKDHAALRISYRKDGSKSQIFGLPFEVVFPDIKDGALKTELKENYNEFMSEKEIKPSARYEALEKLLKNSLLITSDEKQISEDALQILRGFSDHNLQALRTLFSQQACQGIVTLLEQCTALKGAGLYDEFKRTFIDPCDNLSLFTSADHQRAIEDLLALSPSERAFWNQLIHHHTEEGGAEARFFARKIDLVDSVHAFRYFCQQVKKLNPQLKECPLPLSFPKGKNPKTTLQRLLFILQKNPSRAHEQLLYMPKELGNDHAFYAIRKGHQFVLDEMDLRPVKSSDNEYLSYHVSHKALQDLAKTEFTAVANDFKLPEIPVDFEEYADVLTMFEMDNTSWNEFFKLARELKEKSAQSARSPRYTLKMLMETLRELRKINPEEKLNAIEALQLLRAHLKFPENEQLLQKMLSEFDDQDKITMLKAKLHRLYYGYHTIKQVDFFGSINPDSRLNAIYKLIDNKTENRDSILNCLRFIELPEFHLSRETSHLAEELKAAAQIFPEVEKGFELCLATPYFKMLTHQLSPEFIIQLLSEAKAHRYDRYKIAAYLKFQATKSYFFRYLGTSNTLLPIIDLKNLCKQVADHKALKANPALQAAILPLMARALEHPDGLYLDNKKYCDLLINIITQSDHPEKILASLSKFAELETHFNMRDLAALAQYYAVNHEGPLHWETVHQLALTEGATAAFVHLGFRKKINSPPLTSFIKLVQDEKQFPYIQEDQSAIFAILALIEDEISDGKVIQLLTILNILARAYPERYNQFLVEMRKINSEKSTQFISHHDLMRYLLKLKSGKPDVPIEQMPGINCDRFLSAAPQTLSPKQPQVGILKFVNEFFVLQKKLPPVATAISKKTSTESDAALIKKFCQSIYRLSAALPLDQPHEFLLCPLIESSFGIKEQLLLIESLHKIASPFKKRFCLNLINQLLKRETTTSIDDILNLIKGINDQKAEEKPNHDFYQRYEYFSCPDLNDFLKMLAEGKTLDTIFDESDSRPVGKHREFFDNKDEKSRKNVERLLKIKFPLKDQKISDAVASSFARINEIGAKELVNLTRTELIIRLHHAMAAHRDKKSDSIVELLACLRELLFRTPPEHRFANDMQIISVLSSFEYGRFSLTEINTGQGKSIVCALQAAILYSLGHTAVVLSSSPELARRDYLEFRPFFEALDPGNMTTAYVGKGSPKGTFKVGGINYSTTSDFSLYWQAAKGRREPLRKKAGVKFTLSGVIDEEDDLTLSKSGRDHFVLSTKGEEIDEDNDTRWLYSPINLFVDFLAVKEIYLAGKGNPLDPNYKLFTQLAELYQKTAKQLVDEGLLPHSFKLSDDSLIGLEVFACMNYLMSQAITPAQKRQLSAPSFIFMVEQLIEAGKFIKDNIYDSEQKSKEEGASDGFRIVHAPPVADEKKAYGRVEILVGGRPEPGLHYGDGQHQLLLARLAREGRHQNVDFHIEPIYAVKSTRSPDDLIHDLLKTKNSIVVGASGSPGSIAQLREKQERYGAINIKQPPQQKRIVPKKEKSTFFAKNADEQFSDVEKYIQQYNAETKPDLQGGPILIHCDNIKDIKKLKEYLGNKFPGVKINSLTAENHDEEKTLLDQAGNRNQILISNMVKRGTDIKMKDAAGRLKHPKGLLIINLEVQSPTEEQQLEGRTGRQGQPGTYVRILNKEKCQALYQKYFNAPPKSYDLAMVNDIQDKLADQNKQQRDRNIFYDRLVRLIHRQFDKWQELFNEQKDQSDDIGEWDERLAELDNKRIEGLKKFRDIWHYADDFSREQLAEAKTLAEENVILHRYIIKHAIKFWDEQSQLLKKEWDNYHIGVPVPKLSDKILNDNIKEAYEERYGKIPFALEEAPVVQPEVKAVQGPVPENIFDDKKHIPPPPPFPRGAPAVTSLFEEKKDAQSISSDLKCEVEWAARFQEEYEKQIKPWNTWSRLNKKDRGNIPKILAHAKNNPKNRTRNILQALNVYQYIDEAWVKKFIKSYNAKYAEACCLTRKSKIKFSDKTNITQILLHANDTTFFGGKNRTRKILEEEYGWKLDFKTGKITVPSQSGPLKNK